MEKTINLKEGLTRLGLALDDSILEKELWFLDEMIRWSARINLTSIRTWHEGIEKHLLDSLVLQPHCQAKRLLDVGSGAGLPGIPLAIATPEIQITSVESVGKKISFQKHIRRTLQLSHFSPVNCRIEDLPREDQYPLITARAFASMTKIVEMTLPLLEPGGRLILLRGKEGELADPQLIAELQKYKLEAEVLRNYALPFSGAQRQIIQIARS